MIVPLAVSLLAGFASLAQQRPDRIPSGPHSRLPYQPPADARPCALPVVPGTRLIVAGFYEGAGMSSVAVAGQNEETRVGDIRIEPGRERLTLVFTGFDAMVYRFSGATARISRLILLHRPGSGAGAVGLPRARISFGSAEGCSLPYSLYERPHVARAGRGLAALGRAPDAVGGAYQLQWAVVGTGGVNVVPVRRRHWLYRGITSELYRFYPSGLIQLDPRQVVASRPAERFRLLPGTAGIAQLLAQGALVPSVPGDADAWIAAARRSGAYSEQKLRELNGYIRSESYRVVRPIQIPPGLCGAHSVRLFARDPSFVGGDQCHSDVLFANGTARGTSVRPDR